MPHKLTSEQAHRRKWRGKKAELNLVDLLRSLGYNAQRSTMSGLGRNMPDVFATKDSILVAFEVKSARTKYAKISHSQIVKVKEFLDFFNLYPNRIGVTAVTFPYQGWIFHKLKGYDWNRPFLKFTRKDNSDWHPQKPLP